MSMQLRVLGIFTVVLLLAGAVHAQQSSDYLGGDTLSKLQDAQSPSGAKVKLWLAPGFSAGNYDSLILDKTLLYPEPKGSDQVSVATLHEVAAYLDTSLRRELADVMKLTTEPGPRTLRVKPAITGAAAKDQGFKAYDVLPIAFLFSMTKRATGTAAREAAIAVEYEVWDTDSNQLVGAGIRQGTGPLKNPTDQVSVATVKPVIDGWAKDARVFFQSAPRQ